VDDFLTYATPRLDPEFSAQELQVGPGWQAGLAGVGWGGGLQGGAAWAGGCSRLPACGGWAERAELRVVLPRRLKPCASDGRRVWDVVGGSCGWSEGGLGAVGCPLPGPAAGPLQAATVTRHQIQLLWALQVLEAFLQAGCPLAPPQHLLRYKRLPETPLSLSTYRSYGAKVSGEAVSRGGPR
jgi:hypothetical protein